MIGVVTAIFCLASGDCMPVQIPFRGAATPAACERAIAEIEPPLLAQGYERASFRCDGPDGGLGV